MMQSTRSIQRINKSNSCFFEKINKSDRPLAQITKRKRWLHTTRIVNEQGNTTTVTKEIQNITREYFKNMYSIKLENLKKMDKFLGPSKLPKWNQEINNLNRPITNKEMIETVVKSLPTKIKNKTKFKPRWIHNRILSDFQRCPANPS